MSQDWVCGVCGSRTNTMKKPRTCPSCWSFDTWGNVVVLPGRPETGSVRLVSARDLRSVPLTRSTVPERWRSLLGPATGGYVVLLHGSPGTGKSTLTTLAAHQIYESAVIYSLEEGVADQVKSRLQRLEIISDRLWFLTGEVPLMLAFEEALEHEAEAFVIDSVNLLQTSSWQLAKRAKETGVALWMIAHERKDGGYKGSSDLGHSVDVVAKVDSYDGSVFRGTVEKSRFGPCGPFEIAI